MSAIETITAALSGNPILAGGVGTLLFGSAMYVLRAVPEKVALLLGRTLWTTVSVESQSNEYRDVDRFIEARRLPLFSRVLEIKDGSLTTGFGSGWGTYAGKLFIYSKVKSTQQIAPFETITVSFLTRDRTVAERFMSDARPEDHKLSITVTTYESGGPAGALRRRKRSLDTVFLDEAIKQRLVERFTWFRGAERWHAARGIPWKLGVVLHGPPGTGKTSLIHALASDLGFDVKYVKSLNGLGAAFLSGKPNDLFVIEDIDAISGSLNRDSATGAIARGESAGRGSALHELLNAMDGMQTPDGLKVIVTTNHLAKLDPAIVRPGRIDEVIEVGPLSLGSARAMFKAFYGRDGIGVYSPRTGAELQRLFSILPAEAAEAELARGAVAAVAEMPAPRAA